MDQRSLVFQSHSTRPLPGPTGERQRFIAAPHGEPSWRDNPPRLARQCPPDEWSRTHGFTTRASLTFFQNGDSSAAWYLHGSAESFSLTTRVARSAVRMVLGVPSLSEQSQSKQQPWQRVSEMRPGQRRRDEPLFSPPDASTVVHRAGRWRSGRSCKDSLCNTTRGALRPKPFGGPPPPSFARSSPSEDKHL